MNEAAGYSGPIFGPTSLVINNECTGEDPTAPGGGGENRRIRAIKRFCQYYQVPAGNESTLTCKGQNYIKSYGVNKKYRYATKI